MSPSQSDRRESTRSALMVAGAELFAERGFAAVPAEEIVAKAGVTRGALYHHFDGKVGLFRAVFEELETSITAEVTEVIAGFPERLPSILAGVASFLDACQRPEVVRIALTDAPAVLGWQTWREIETAHGLGIITENLQLLAEDGLLKGGNVPVLAQLMLSAVIESALLIAHSDDPDAARTQTQEGLLLFLAGIVDLGHVPSGNS